MWWRPRCGGVRGARYEATEYGEAYMYVILLYRRIILPEAKVGSRYTHTHSVMSS